MSIANTIDNKLNTDEIISVFCNPEDNYSTVVGFTAAIDETHFVLKHVTVEGRYDGYVLRCKDQIFRIDEKTSYETNLQKLYKHYGEKHIDFEVGNSVLSSLLAFAQKHKFIVGVGIKDFESNSIFGFVHSIDPQNGLVIIQQVNDEGVFDGFSTVSFDTIVRMSCDCEKDAMLKVLNSFQ